MVWSSRPPPRQISPASVEGGVEGPKTETFKRFRSINAPHTPLVARLVRHFQDLWEGLWSANYYNFGIRLRCSENGSLTSG